MSNAGARLLYVSSRASMMNYRSYLGTIKVPVRKSKLESATKHDYIGLRNPTHCGFSTVWLLSQIAWNQLQRQPWLDRQARGSLRGRHNKYQRLHGCLLQHDRPPPPNYLLLDSAAILWLWTWAQQSYQLYKKTHVLAFQSMANNTVTNFRVKCRISLLKQQCQYMSET
jgi:hypothetical protein